MRNQYSSLAPQSRLQSQVLNVEHFQDGTLSPKFTARAKGLCPPSTSSWKSLRIHGFAPGLIPDTRCQCKLLLCPCGIDELLVSSLGLFNYIQSLLLTFPVQWLPLYVQLVHVCSRFSRRCMGVGVYAFVYADRPVYVHDCICTCVSMYVYVCLCCVCMHACLHLYASLRVRTCAEEKVHMCDKICIYIHICMYILLCVITNLCVHVSTHARKHTDTPIPDNRSRLVCRLPVGFLISPSPLLFVCLSLAPSALARPCVETSRRPAWPGHPRILRWKHLRGGWA